MDYTPAPNIETTLPGLTLTSVRGAEVGGGVVTLDTSDGRSFSLHHEQDCCESVDIHDVQGAVEDLLGTPLLEVKEKILREWPADVPQPEYLDSYTLTVFTFRTAKGTVTIRWLGQSNGYYSESVSFVETTTGF